MNFILYAKSQFYETVRAYFPEELLYVIGCKLGYVNHYCQNIYGVLTGVWKKYKILVLGVLCL